MANIHERAEIVCENNFPAGAGIASSASAFASLALAGSKAAGLNLTEPELSRLARRGSGSASRSIPSGFVEWQVGTTDDDSFAFSIAPAEHWKLMDCIAIVSASHKKTGSTEGHAIAPTSPLQAARVADTPRRLDLCRNAILDRDFGAFASIVELDSDIMHSVMMTSTPALHYWKPASLAVMNNGDTMIPIQIKEPDDLALKLKGGMPGTEDRGMIWTEGFQEVRPGGKVIWEWSMADHLDPNIHVLCPIEFRGDYTHMNSCEVLPDGNVLTSFRNIDTVCIIEKQTGELKWQWGPGEISHPHNPTLLDNGKILLFDNGAHRKNGSSTTYSRVIEVDPTTDKIEWEYKGIHHRVFILL